MFSLWQLWLTTTNLSYTFPIFETSATASCGSSSTRKTCFLNFQNYQTKTISVQLFDSHKNPKKERRGKPPLKNAWFPPPEKTPRFQLPPCCLPPISKLLPWDEMEQHGRNQSPWMCGRDDRPWFQTNIGLENPTILMVFTIGNMGILMGELLVSGRVTRQMYSDHSPPVGHPERKPKMAQKIQVKDLE